MSEQFNTLPTAVTALQQDGYLILEADLARVELDRTACEAHFNSLLRTADVLTMQHLEDVSAAYFNVVDAAIAKSNPQPDLLSFIKDSNLPDPIKEAFELKTELESHKDYIEEKLEHYAPGKAAEILVKARAIEQAIKYEELVERGSLKEDFQEQREHVYRIIRTRKFYEAGHIPSYQESKLIEQSLDAYAVSLKESDLLFEDPLDISEIHSKAPGLTLNAQKLREALVLYRMYKKDSKEIDELAELMFEEAISMALFFRSDEEADATAKDLINKITASYNDTFELALTNKLLEKLQGMPIANLETDTSSEFYKTMVEQMKHISLGEALKDISLEIDQKNLPFEIDTKDLLTRLAALTPRIALQQIKELSITSFTAEGYNISDEERELIGFTKFAPHLNGYKILINADLLRRDFENALQLYGDSPDMRTIITTLLNKQLVQILFHEAGHVLHHVLPLATLKRWDKRRLSDPVNISEYVQYANSSLHEDGEPEDFCDSLRFFITEPDKLPLISPPRHAGMEEIFEDLMPGYTEVLKPYLEQKGNDDKLRWQLKTDEERKAAYLAHENSKNNVS